MADVPRNSPTANRRSRHRVRRTLLAGLAGLLLTGCGSTGGVGPVPRPVDPVSFPATPRVAATPLPLGTATPTPEPAPVELRVMSFNVRHADISARSAHHPDAREFQWTTSRGPAAVKYVRQADPDIIGFQEVKPQMKGIKGQRIPGKMITVLAGGLPAYTFTATPERNNFLPIAFKTGKFTLLDSGRIQIQYTTDKGSDSNRFATWAMLKVTQTGQRLLVANLWANDGSRRYWAIGRALAWQRLLPALADLTDDNRIPAITLGDFNAVDDRDEYPFNAHLTAFPEAGWLDASQAPITLQKMPDVASYNGWGQKVDGVFRPNAIRTGPRLDYIWTHGGITPLTWQIFLPEIEYRTVDGRKLPFAKGTIPSDHWPVVADLALPPAAH